MFFKTTISGVNNNTSLFRLNDDSSTEYIFNVKHISDIVDYGGGSRFSIVNNYNSRWAPTVITCSTSQSDVISTFDNVTMSDVYTASCFKDNNIAKDVLAKDILTENIVLIYSHHNPSYSWLIYDNGYRLTKVLINDTLDDILFLLMVVSSDYLVLTSQGDGTGITTIKFEVSDNVILSLSGTARFYSDAAGTLDESATWTITPGALRTYYLKCPSGTAELYFSDISKVIKWGDIEPKYYRIGAIDGWLGNINAPSISGNLKVFTSIQTIVVGTSNTLSATLAELSTSIINIVLHDNNSLSGKFSELPPLIEMVSLRGTYFNLIGDIVDIPDTIVSFELISSDATPHPLITGVISSLSTKLSLKLFIISMYGHTIGGDIADLPPLVIVPTINHGIIPIIYTSGRIWSDNMESVSFRSYSVGLTSTEVDNLLIDLADTTWQSVSWADLHLNFANEPRTAASDAAVLALQGMGVDVNTN